MDEQLKKILAQFLQLMLDGIQKGAQFAGEQIPLVLQEKLHYELISNLLWGGFWLFIIVVAWFLAEWAIRTTREDRSPRACSEAKIFFRVSASVVTLISLLLTSWFLDCALMIWVAPRVYILEWLKGMIK